MRDLAVLHDGFDTGDDGIAALKHFAAVSGQVRLTLSCVDEQRIDGVGSQLDMGRETGAAYAHQAAVLHGSHQAGFVGDRRWYAGRVDGLLAVGLDGNGSGHAAVDHAHRGNILYRAGYAGINAGTDKAAGLADESTNHNGVAFFDDGLGRGTDVHRHGNNDMLRRRHLDGGQPGSRFRMGHIRAFGGAFQGFEQAISPILVWHSGRVNAPAVP